MPIWVVESNENLDSTMCPRFHVDEFVWSVFQPTLSKNLDFVLNLAKVSIDGVEEFNTRTPNYVDGNWQPIHNELERVPVQGKGELPKNLIGGMYVRSGANPKCWPPGNRLRNHAFNGESMLHM